MEYRLRDDCFLIGNNCGVGWVYKDILQKPYETPFVWNYLTHDGMFNLSRIWDDIDWHAQDWTPREVGSYKAMQEKYDGFYIFRSHFPIELWWDLTFHGRNGETVSMLLPHLDLRDGAKGHGKLAHRVERFMEILETKEPVFVFTRNYDYNHWTDEQRRVVAADPRCVLCDINGERLPTKRMAHSVVFPRLLKKGFITKDE